MECNIFKVDNSTIDVLKLLNTLWKNRKNETMVRGLAETLSAFAIEKKTMNEIEFYLPQIAQLIIHLEAESASNQSLEYLAIAIAQASIHCAQQLSGYFIAAMEDYQPELKTGGANPKANLLLYYRAARILQNVERAMVYGTPVLTAQQEDYMRQQFSGSDFEEMYDSEKAETAGRIVRSNMGKAIRMGVSEGVSGRLQYKSSTGAWSQVFCKVDQKVLFCFKDNMANALPIRSLLLEGCSISAVPNPDQPFTFTVNSQILQTSFTLRGSDQSDMEAWIRFLSTEATRAPTPSTDTGVTEGQAKRHLYLIQMQSFIVNLVGISEKLRLRPLDVRKFFLRKYLSDLPLPPLACLPSSLSLDKFKHLIKTLPCESTASRCNNAVPISIFFEAEQHSLNADLAAFLLSELQEYSDQELRASAPPRKSDLILDRPATEEDGSVGQEMIVSRMRIVPARPVWRPCGSGMDGLEEKFTPPPAGSKGRESLTVPIAETLINSNASMAPTATASNAIMQRSKEFETMEAKGVRVRAASPAGYLSNWTLVGVTAMSGVDARQEAVVNQLICYYASAFKEAGLPAEITTSRVVPVAKSSAIAQLVPNVHTLEAIKRHCDYPGSLLVYFEKAYGGTSDAPQFKLALDNFVVSMAGYSVLCYLLGIKGRDASNMALDPEGRIVHSDFSNVFNASPVTTPLFMADAPFVLDADMVALMNGRFSAEFAKYATLCGQYMIVARKHYPTVSSLLEIIAELTDLSCIKSSVLTEFGARHILGTPDMSVEYEFNFLIERAMKAGK